MTEHERVRAILERTVCRGQQQLGTTLLNSLKDLPTAALEEIYLAARGAMARASSPAVKQFWLRVNNLAEMERIGRREQEQLEVEELQQLFDL